MDTVEPLLLIYDSGKVLVEERAKQGGGAVALKQCQLADIFSSC